MCSRSLRIFTAALLFLCGLHAQARELRICADPNNLPFSNDKHEGFENRIVDLIARELEAEVTYTWHAQRRGFLRETLKDFRCDLVPGMPSNLEGVRTTAPYYRSTYVFVVRDGEALPQSFNDPILRRSRVGVQLVGDDGWNTPPAHALARRGIVDNIRGYTLYGDYRQPNPPSRIIRAVADGEIDIAVAWGPMAGYFATREGRPLALKAVSPSFDGPQMPMVWDISMGLRKEDDELRVEVDRAMQSRRAEIDTILAQYGVPRMDEPGRQAAGVP
jgi:mxaJ protein